MWTHIDCNSLEYAEREEMIEGTMVNPLHWEHLYTSCTVCDKWPWDILGSHCQYLYLILVKFNLFTFLYFKKIEIYIKKIEKRYFIPTPNRSLCVSHGVRTPQFGDHCSREPSPLASRKWITCGKKTVRDAGEVENARGKYFCPK